MNNYPDNAQPGAPDAPWHQPDAPACTKCGTQLDDDALDAGERSGRFTPGWVDGLCSDCADEEDCACDDTGYCSPRCTVRAEAQDQALDGKLLKIPTRYLTTDSRDEHDPTL